MDSHLPTADPIAQFPIDSCYQCGKCTAGCPMAERMDVMPNQVVRLVQVGRIDQALKAESIWLCVSCQTCSTRCPKSFDCAGLMDALRQMSIEQEKASPLQRRVHLFQRSFLQNICRNGRLNEVELIGLFKTAAFVNDLNLPFLFKDALLAPKLQKRHKFHLRGEKVRDRAIVRRIFERCR